MIYFDAGATTLEKPEAVRHAMARAVATMSSPGRGTYPASQQAEETAYQCRSEAAELFGMDLPENVIFTENATHGLNIAIKSLVKPGSRVVISGYEHNAVTRPLYSIPNVRLTVVDTLPFQPGQMAEEFARALQQGADVVICNHVSNVFGCIQPVDEIAALCRRYGVPLIVDASQSAGVLPVRMDEWQAAFIAMPGHKGLYGPQGTGLLLCNHETNTLMEGGTGSLSRQQQMPEDLPDRLEAGTHNMPGIAGLLEGIRFVKRRGVDKICRQEQNLTEYAARRLELIDKVQLFTDGEFINQTGVLSFLVANRDCEEIGEKLAQRGIAVRAGLQCAPLAHRTAGTLKGGTVRFSASVFNTMSQVDRFAAELQDIIRENVKTKA